MRRHGIIALALWGFAALPVHSGAQPLGTEPGARTAVLDVARDTAEVGRLSGDLQRVEGELGSLTPAREGLHARARQQTRWLYHMLQGNALALRGGPEALMDHAVRAGHMRRVLHATLRALDATTARAQALEAERGRIQGLLDAARAHRSQVEAAQRTAMGVLQPVGAEGQTVTVYGGAPGPVGESFAVSAGRLLFPVLGRAEVRRAMREGAEGPGLDVLVAEGTAVRAVFPGRVAFADHYGTYGQIVIVDHGDHYYSVSANLGRIDVRVGQELAAGESLGTVGVGDDGKAMLYFEVRRGGDTIDPVPWLGL